MLVRAAAFACRCVRPPSPRLPLVAARDIASASSPKTRASHSLTLSASPDCARAWPAPPCAAQSARDQLRGKSGSVRGPRTASRRSGAYTPDNVAREGNHRFDALLVGVPRVSSGQHQARGHALHVPLPGPDDGFVEVVDVEDKTPVGSFERAQVLHVCVATEREADVTARNRRHPTPDHPCVLLARRPLP